MPKIITPREYLDSAKQRHGDHYDYSLTQYQGMNRKLIVRCTRHDRTVEVTGVGHLAGNGGCPECKNAAISASRMLTREQFLQRARALHGNTYDYNKLVYTGVETQMTFICREHGEFQQLGQNHIHKTSGGYGCKRCADAARGLAGRVSFEQFLQRARAQHGMKYQYDSHGYTKVTGSIGITCEAHGVFTQTPEVHLRGHGCPLCSNWVSRGETRWLDSLGIPEAWRQFMISRGTRRYCVDACDHQRSIVYEFYGDFWHGNPRVFPRDRINPVTGTSFGELYDRTMSRQAELQELGFEVICMWESDCS